MENLRLLGVDIGGSFTDAILIGKNEIKIIKISSTPEDPTVAVQTVLSNISEPPDELLHGTTVATNAILERKGAKVAFLTTSGFRDVLEIGRQKRDDIYSLIPTRPSPLVPRDMRFSVKERVLADGTVEIPLDKEEMNRILQELQKLTDLESIAIGFLFSFLNPIHEQTLKSCLQTLGKPISISYEVVPEYREYERFSTTVMDAYIKPLISRYLSKIEKACLKINPKMIFAVMKSSTGLALASSLVDRPVETVVSGLAGGVLAAEFTSRFLDRPNIISLDIGGTSSDIAQIYNYHASKQHGLKIGGLPVSIPSVDVITVGAGGGSIAKNESGFLRVGPESAGANPGPACYGKGGKNATVTDADLLFGILPDNLGAMKLDKSLAEQSVREVAESLQINIEDCVHGIQRVFHENIANALREISTERGVDPRNFSLLVFGGAGPVHGTFLAEIMGISEVIVPPYPGIWSAFGLLTGNFRYDVSQGFLSAIDAIDPTSIETAFEDITEQIQSKLQSDGLEHRQATYEKTIDLRFIGQSFEISVPWNSSVEQLKSDFIAFHRRLYGFADDTQPIEAVTLRLAAIIEHQDPVLPKIQSNNKPSPKEFRTILRLGTVPVYDKTSLGANHSIDGPAIIVQQDSTIWIDKNWNGTMNRHGFLMLIPKDRL